MLIYLCGCYLQLGAGKSFSFDDTKVVVKKECHKDMAKDRLAHAVMHFIGQDQDESTNYAITVFCPSAISLSFAPPFADTLSHPDILEHADLPKAYLPPLLFKDPFPPQG